MTEPSVSQSQPRLGVALGSGAAHGLAHIAYIEAMDELGIRPDVISGTSVGALIGVGWANGMSGLDLREHALSSLGSMQLIAGRLWTNHRPTLKKFLQQGISMQVDAETIVDAFLPEGFPNDFSDLQIPFSTIATDFRAWKPVVFNTGVLRTAVAASIAIPSLFKPVKVDGQIYIDGGVTNPLPLDQVAANADIVLGIDVNGGPDEKFNTIDPNMLDVGYVATQIMTQTLVDNARHHHPPTIYVQPPVNEFGMLEFWRVGEIVARMEEEKEDFKRTLSEQISFFK